MELLGFFSTTLCRGAGIWTPIISLQLHQTWTFEGRWGAQPTELQRRGKVDSAVLFSFPDGLHPAEAAPVLRRASGVPHPHVGDLALHRLLASHRCLAFRHIGENQDFETFGIAATVKLLPCCTAELLLCWAVALLSGCTVELLHMFLPRFDPQGLERLFIKFRL